MQLLQAHAVQLLECKGRDKKRRLGVKQQGLGNPSVVQYPLKDAGLEYESNHFAAPQFDNLDAGSPANTAKTARTARSASPALALDSSGCD